MRFLKHALAAALMMTAVSGAASAADQDFKLVNKTGYQIDEVYVSSAASKNWGRDIMGTDALADGSSTNITFPRSTSQCSFDIKVKYNDGEEKEWGGVDLCKFSKISLYYTNGNTRAVGE